ncbi:MAG: pyridoxal 5'-phosphate synthase glutaminase subunit PdxT [Candidatus Heimdallarchaeota archaeon]|nr:pyridoxal 5'-phosphate synthase glutaminase subunit PdxT [Candidatus Heimdallarchaeota archaeon]MDH5646091.1 pyridoxal 5'-phosphate synthase glutaminase subunit PdxT [Candidatus Heimdallarchaeota archaeon]
MLKIGILGLQGAIEEHENALLSASKALNVPISLIRLLNPEDLEGIHGIVIPGGESSAMILIGNKTGMLQAVKNKIESGTPAFGTCAGAILLSKRVRRTLNSEVSEGAFPVVDIEILRNGYGRQRDSFSTVINIEDKPFEAIFIRAPIINTVSNHVEILSLYQDKAVIIQQGNILVSTFHPELSNDNLIHRKFLQIIGNFVSPNNDNYK